MSKRFVKSTLFALATLLGFAPGDSFALCNNSSGSAQTDLGYVRFTLEPVLNCDLNSILWLGEFGPKHIRLNGTYGWRMGPNSFFKVGGEWLTQDLKYKFYSGTTDRWISQWALGGAYRFVCQWACISSYFVNFEYSKAHNLQLSDYDCSSAFFLRRRIAGAEVGGGTLGVTASLWQGGELAIGATYDHVFIHRKYESDKKLNGFGVALAWKQRICRRISMNIVAEHRVPYDFVEAQLNFADWQPYGDYNVGLFVNYTHGKSGLPNTLGYGISFGADLGGQSYYSGCTRSSSCRLGDICVGPMYDVVAWTSIPAVYVPEVLAITDQIFLAR